MKAEQRFIVWAEDHDVEWLILRPTLIYGTGFDRNVSESARFISRFGFFPVLEPASGLRQPVHVEDVAIACKRALETKDIVTGAYHVAGGEILTYRRCFCAYLRRSGKARGLSHYRSDVSAWPLPVCEFYRAFAAGPPQWRNE